MKHLVFPAIALLLLAQPLPAEEAEHGQAGYEDMPEFGGPESVTEQLKRADELREAPYDWPFFDGYFDWKRQVDDDYGVSFGLHFYGLYQKANNSLPGRDAMGNIFRFLGNWTVFEKDNGNLGRIEWRLESRSDWFGLQAPGSLGSATGTGIRQRQGWVCRRPSGLRRLPRRVPVPDLLEGLHQPLIHSEPDPADHRHRRAGRRRERIRDFDTVQEGEWLKAVEVGYTPSFGQRKSHLVQFTYWDKDARSLAGVSSGSGWAVSAAWKLNDTYFPFVRIGHSDGGGGVAAETAVSGGVEISRPRGEVWTIGAGWAKPSEETFGPGLDNETALEMSYKFPISKNLSILPDAQIIFSPANNPGRTSIWVIGVRAILTL
jgi:hypothetical protein